MTTPGKTCCVYCDAEVTPTKAEVKKHVLRCEKGPLYTLKKSVEKAIRECNRVLNTSYDQGLQCQDAGGTVASNVLAILREGLRNSGV